MQITLLNTELELASFPLTQTIKLKLDEDVDLLNLQNFIYIFDISRQDNLIKLSNPHNYNLGLIKRDFISIEVDFKKEVIQLDEYLITVTPKQPLKLTSSYMLFIDYRLSKSFINTQKLVSISNSNISVTTPSTYVIEQSVSIKVLETVKASGDRRLKLQINDIKVTLDLNKQKTYKLDSGLAISFDSPLYLKDEEFLINTSSRIIEELPNKSYIFSTVSDIDIPASIELEEMSTKISNQDILNFYNQPVVVNPEIVYTINYLDLNIIEIILPDTVTKGQIDIANLVVQNKIAFNNFLLKQLKLYEDKYKYIIKPYWVSFNNSLVLEFIYSEDDTQVETFIIDMSSW